MNKAHCTLVNPESIKANKEILSKGIKKRREKEIYKVLEGLGEEVKPFYVFLLNTGKPCNNMDRRAEELGGQVGTDKQWKLWVLQQVLNGESWAEAVQCPVAPIVYVKDDEQGYGISISNGFVNLSTIGMYAGDEPLCCCNGKMVPRSKLSDEVKEYGLRLVHPYKDPIHTIPFAVVPVNE